MIKQINVKGAQRLELWNNYVNVISLLLILLSLATIPISFFSLRAARDGESVLRVETMPITSFTITASIYGAQLVKDYGITLEKDQPKELGVQLSAGFNFKSDFTIPIKPDGDKPLFVFKIIIDTEEKLSEQCLKPVGEPDIHPSNVTLCFEVKSLPFVEIVPTLWNWRLVTKIDYSGLQVGTLHNSSPHFTCEAQFCWPQFLFIVNGVEGVSVIPSFYQSYFFPSGLVLYYKEGNGKNSYLDVPTFQVVSYQSTDKYTVTDNVIDSFAISGVVLSTTMLFLTLVKLLLWFCFSSWARRSISSRG